MRVNTPITQREYAFPDSATLMSVTDTQSNITYANAAFVAVSGFGREEIIGQPHNLVRHPDFSAYCAGRDFSEAVLLEGRHSTPACPVRRRATASPTRRAPQQAARPRPGTRDHQHRRRAGRA